MNGYIVLKKEDIECLDNEQKIQLEKIISFISGYRKAQGKETNPIYLIVNEKEPYIFMVKEAIEQGEIYKKGGSDFK